MITKDTYSKLYEYHKLAYEKYFIPTAFLNIVAIICFVIVLFTAPYASPIVIVLFIATLVMYKREAHREGFVDGFTEASSIYSSLKSKNADGQSDEDSEADGLLETPEYIQEIKETIKLFQK